MRLFIFYAGGAFKTMPISPKDIKPIITAGGVIVSENENQGEVKPTPPTVFTFTNASSTPNSKESFKTNFFYDENEAID